MKFPLFYTLFVFHLNSMLDRGIHVPINDIRLRIDDGSIFDWLQANFGLDMDMSLHSKENLTEMLNLFQQLTNTINSRRKMGVEFNGISLLLAFSIEGIQQGY